MTPEFVIGLGVFVCAILDLWPDDKWITGIWQKVFVSALAGLSVMGLVHLVRIVVEGLATISGAGK